MTVDNTERQFESVVVHMTFNVQLGLDPPYPVVITLKVHSGETNHVECDMQCGHSLNNTSV